MKSRLSQLVVCCCLLSAISATGYAAAGRTVGTFNVSPTGSATYTIPLWNPPGPRGIQPNLALVYNSQSGDGILGFGWNMAGLSAITRCNLTVAQDGTAGAVALAAGDRYCMDGKRLRLTSSETLSTYGNASTTYQTEVADFSNVTASSTTTGSGPSYFTVQLRNGLIYEYGNTSTTYSGGPTSNGSQVTLSGSSTVTEWLIDKVSDRAGNNYIITYTQPTGASGVELPSTIVYTPSSAGSTSYNYTITFTYGTRYSQIGTTNNTTQTGYVAAINYSDPYLLTGITVAYSGTTIHQYNFTYGASPTTTRPLLTSLTECGGSSGTDCLAPTNITYQTGSAGVSTTAATAVSGSNLSVIATRDFDGDGRDDILYLNTSTSTLYVAFATSSGFSSPVSVASYSLFYTTLIAYGDVLGLGQIDIFIPVYVSGSYVWWRYHWNGSSFSGASTGVTLDPGVNQAALQDVNGDGLADLITADGGSGPITIYARLNTSSGGTLSFDSSESTTTGPSCFPGDTCSSFMSANGGLQSNLRALDFNGDGRQDLLVTTTNTDDSEGIPTYGYTTTLFTSTSTPSTASFSQVSGTSFGPNPTFLPANDDQCTDIAAGTAVYYAGCDGALPTYSYSVTSPNGALDWDGDGRQDLITESSGGYFSIQTSTGSGFTSAATSSVPWNSNFFIFDQNGDGLEDIGVWTSSGISYYLHNGSDAPPDLLSSITDGYGNSISPAYASIVQSNYTNYTDGTYPYENYVGPLYVVTQATYSDPSSTSGGTYQKSFYYAGAWMNLQGRGFSSFAGTQTYDSRNTLWETYGYYRQFPYNGALYADVHSQDSAVTLPIVYTQHYRTFTALDSTTNNQRSYVYPTSLIARTYELNGPENGDLVTTSSTDYSYDSYGNATSIATTVTDNDPGSPYSGDSWTATTTNTPDVDTSTWCLPLFTEAQVAYTASVGTAVTRTKTFTPDLTNCRYTQVVTEPSSSTYKVTEALTYDNSGGGSGFGNITEDSVTGIGMSARNTYINWATAGQFPLNITDPSGAETQYVYNYSYGEPSSVTDPNGLVTSFQYDDFGRMDQRSMPDGTYATWSYAPCADDGDCLFGSNTLMVDYEIHNTDASLQRDTVSNYDQLGSPFLKLQLLPDGSYGRHEIRYDSLGRIVRQYSPCTWTVATSLCPYFATNSYDAINRLTQTQRPISSTNSTLQTTTYAYAGRTETITDPYTNTKTAVGDVNGWQRKTKDAYGYTAITAYDAAGSKTGVSDSDGKTLWSGSYGYGIAPFNVSATDADLGSWSYTYDALGELTSWTDAKSQSFSETYDALSRPLTRSEPDYFTQWTWGSSASIHEIGKLASVCTGLGTSPTSCTSSGYSENETYDSDGRPHQRSIVIPSDGTFTYTRLYSSTTGLLDTLTYPTSTSSYALQLQYAYSYGLPTSITDVSDSPNITLWTANAMDAAGQITEETLGNGIVTNRSYDAVTSWLGALTAGVGGGTGVENQGWLYDEVGNVTQRQDNNLSLTEDFYYDNDYRLTSSKLNTVSNLAVTYGSNGNITSRSDIAAGASWTYSTSQIHAVTQAGSSAYTYTYDANGNAITRNGSTVSWDAANYPTSVSTGTESVAFAYGPGRQRWQQNYNSGTETTDYIGGLMEQVFSGGTTTYRHYVYAGNEPVAVYARTSTLSNTWNYFLSDHQGSISAITNSSGGVVINEDFAAFGARRDPATWSGAPSSGDLTTIAGLSRQGYTFQTALGQSMGLNHMNGRVQDAITGRFLSGDPNIPDPTNAQSYNRYSYVVNNPLTRVDPTGFEDNCDAQSTPVDSTGCLAEATVTASQIAPFSGAVVTGIAAFDVSNDPDNSGQVLGGGLSGNAKGGAAAALPPAPTVKQPQTTPACSKYPRQAAFVNANLPDATQIANQLNTAPGDILGLAGFESNWGGGQLITAGTNNYFSLKAGPAFATGATGTYQYGPNTFWTYSGPGMLASGNAFAQSYFGTRVNGITDPQAFATALNAGGKYNSDPNYNSTLVSTINQANAVMGCP